MIDEAVHILLVEDDDALRFIVKDNLELHHYKVDVAADFSCLTRGTML